MSSFKPLHLFPLAIATGNAFGGLMPFFNTPRAILTAGLSPAVAAEPLAYKPFKMYASRASIIGSAIWIFYLRGQFEAMDTLLGLLGYGALVDARLAWVDGELRFLPAIAG